MKRPKNTDRILILAPHPDDEILGAGGYIYTALKNKSKIKIVIATCGENFSYAMGKELVNFLPLDKKSIEFGELRQKECLKTLQGLGLKNKDIIFLGFPDKGIKDLWTNNWSNNNPYLSPILKVNHSPFLEVYKKNILFSGEELELILKKIVDLFKPNIIIAPSLGDDHPDHKYLAKFLQKALTSQSKKRGKIQLYSFLIHKHHFMYPRPYGLYPDKKLNPPLSYRKKNIAWQEFVLNKQTIDIKKKAILSYRTQVIAMKKRLLSFLRKNELFERIK